MIAAVPPFKRASENDVLFRLIARKEYEAFWNFHEQKQKIFSSDLKELLQGLLASNPKERFSINDIRASSWHNGKIAETKDLKLEFDQYTAVIEGLAKKEKEKRKEESRRRQQATNMQNLDLTTRIFIGGYRDVEMVIKKNSPNSITINNLPRLRTSID